MRQIIINLCNLAFWSLLTTNTQAALSPKESDEFDGQEAAAFKVQSVQGKDVSLKENHGHVILLNFFASWCPPCRAEIGQLTELNKEYSKRGLVVLGLAVDSILTPDTVKDVKPLVESLSVPYPVAVTTKQIADDYKFKGIPTTIIIGSDGKIAKIFYGYHDAKAFKGLVDGLIEKSKAVPSSPAKTAK